MVHFIFNEFDKCIFEIFISNYFKLLFHFFILFIFRFVYKVVQFNLKIFRN